MLARRCYDGALPHSTPAAILRPGQAQSEGLHMKPLRELLDSWENGTLREADLKQLKTLLEDPTVRAEVRADLSFFGLLNEVLREESLEPAEAPAARSTDLEQFERTFTSASAKVRALLLRLFT